MRLTPQQFRVRVYSVSHGKIKYHDQPCDTLPEAKKKALAPKLGTKAPGTITYRISQVDVEQRIEKHWTLLQRRNSRGKFVVEGPHVR